MSILRSIRFNIFLGALIAIASAVGTFIPQAPETPEKAQAFLAAHPALGRFYDFFGLFDVYHSWWFVGLLGLMALDIVACKLWNKPPDLGLVSLPPEETREEEAERHMERKAEALRLKPLKSTFRSSLPYEEVDRRVPSLIEAEGYRLRPELKLDAASAFVATRHGLQRWGSYLSHIALVVILGGALIKSVWGFAEMVPVVEGHSSPVRHLPGVRLWVDDFSVTYYKGTKNASSFASKVRVEKDGEIVSSGTIRVNDPLDFHGARFYQASWGAGGMFRDVVLKMGNRKFLLPQRKPVPIPGTPFRVEADVMLPDFTVTPQGQADTRSLDLRDPGVRIFFLVGPHKTHPIWLFENHPGVALAEQADGTLSHAPQPPFRLAAIHPVLFSGIQVAYDPGFKVVMAGSALWLIGMGFLFYLHRRRLWVLIEPAEKPSTGGAGGGETLVTLGGWSSRGARAYAVEFERISKSLARGLGGGAELRITVNPVAEVV